MEKEQLRIDLVMIRSARSAMERAKFLTKKPVQNAVALVKKRGLVEIVMELARLKDSCIHQNIFPIINLA